MTKFQRELLVFGYYAMVLLCLIAVCVFAPPDSPAGITIVFAGMGFMFLFQAIQVGREVQE